MACLRRLGVPWGEDVLGLAVYKEVPLPSVRWLEEQGAPWDDDDAVRFVIHSGVVCGDSTWGAWRRGVAAG